MKIRLMVAGGLLAVVGVLGAVQPAGAQAGGEPNGGAGARSVAAEKYRSMGVNVKASNVSCRLLKSGSSAGGRSGPWRSYASACNARNSPRTVNVVTHYDKNKLAAYGYQAAPAVPWVQFRFWSK